VKPFLTAAMIVKDEAGVLDDCLASIADAVDEVVIADTGSTDRSREIAAAHGARVIEHPWTGDFSAARNAALAEARGAWILYIDADERLRPAARDYVRESLAAAHLIAARLWLRQKSGYTPCREYRLFRNDPRIRYRGLIHEKVLPDILRIAAQEDRQIADVDLHLDHVGYDGPQMHKHRRNLPLLRAQLAAEPDNAYNWHHLGRVLEGLGDPAAALEAWQRSVEVVRRLGPRRPSDWLAYAELIRQALPGLARARSLHEEAARLFPDNPLLDFLDGQIRLEAGDWQAARDIFARLAAIDAEGYRDQQVSFDKRLFGEYAFAGVAACCFKGGDYARSAGWFARAAAANPQSLEYRAKQQLAQSRAAARS
jgi:glycosyltransferase involved in cell wall biosynthesis